MAVRHFGGQPHGTEVTDGAGVGRPIPAGDPAWVGYPNKVTVVALDGTLIEATRDIEQVDGKTVIESGAVWIELGTVGAAQILRLGRVRYPVLRSVTNAASYHTGEVNASNIPGDVGITTVVDPCDERPDSGDTNTEIKAWLVAYAGYSLPIAGPKAVLLGLVADFCDS